MWLRPHIVILAHALGPHTLHRLSIVLTVIGPQLSPRIYLCYGRMWCGTELRSGPPLEVQGTEAGSTSCCLFSPNRNPMSRHGLTSKQTTFLFQVESECLLECLRRCKQRHSDCPRRGNPSSLIMTRHHESFMSRLVALRGRARLLVAFG